MKFSWLTPIFLWICVVLVGTPAVAENPFQISPETWEVHQGGVLSISVSGEGLQQVTLLKGKRRIPFYSAAAEGKFDSLVGADLDETVGTKKLLVQARGPKGTQEFPVVLRVAKKDYGTEKLSLPKSFDRFDEATLKRIRREKKRISRFWSISDTPRRWKAPFVAPVPGGVTSPFGRRRVINGSPRSPHSGVDLRAAEGTVIRATNHGKVVLVDEFYFNGKSVVLDHGAGLYSMYFHLSDYGIEEGAAVRKGDVIGRVGMTGRVSGPHLHWGARLNGARVDPFELLKIVWDKQ